MSDMEFKACPTEFKAAGDGTDGKYEGHFSVFGNIDDGGDIAEPGMFAKTIKENGHRVKVFFAHDWMKLIGPPPEQLAEDSVGLFAKGRLTTGSFWGNEAWQLMKDGAMTEGSFGYQTVKADFDEAGVRHLREVKLFEISPVPLGMNALTDVQAVKALLFHQAKAAIRPKSEAKAPEDTPWSAADVLKEVEGATALRRIHAWFDAEADPDLKGSYKFPHHLADFRVVLKGVQAVGSVLMGGRGGAKIPASDVAGVKAHMELHYKQFDATPPWQKSAEEQLAEKIDGFVMLMNEIKDGKALMTADKDQVKKVLEALDALTNEAKSSLAAVQPEVDATHRWALLQTRLRAAESALAFTLD